MGGLSAAQESITTQLHVATAGSDVNSGTRESPFATLAGARDAIRKLKRDGLKTPVEVIVQAGTYPLAKSLTFGPQDSGTLACPITYKAAEGAKVVLSGGVPLNGWRKVNDTLWAIDVPPALPDFRILRVGDRWATRARHPNNDPARPYTGGWLFAQFDGEPWEQGLLDAAVQNLQKVDTKLTWKIRTPASGLYRVWLRYAHNMTAYNLPNMAGRSTIRADGGDPVPLRDLPDTGTFDTFRWSHVADLNLTAGEQELQWVNVKGGGLALDAWALTDDETWNPEKAFVTVHTDISVQVQPPAKGKNLLIVQAEACTTPEGQGIRIPSVHPPGTTKHLKFRRGDLPSIADPSRAEVHTVLGSGWVNAILPIDSADYEACRIQFPGNNTGRDMRAGNRYFLENVGEALDAPGEWFFDTGKRQLLHYADQPGLPSLPTVAAVLHELIVLKGDPVKNEFVEHLNFEGLHFADTTYSLTDDYYHPADAAVVMAGARHCVVRKCEFAWLGGYALRLSDRSEQCTFRENHVHHVGQGGVIALGGTQEQSHHCAVLGNVMEHLGLIYKHVAGIYLTHGSDYHIAHNRITDAPRYAISFKSQGEHRLSHRNVAEFNDIRRCNLETNDSGAIESLGYERRDGGNVIRHNLILDSVGMATTPGGKILTPHFTWGIYLDDYSSGATVYGNIVARTVVGGGCIHGGQNNVFENNVFVEGHEHQMRLQPRNEFMKGNKFVRNIVAYSRPEAHLIFSLRNQPGMFSEFDRNLYWLKGADLKAITAPITPAGAFAQWQTAGYDTHSLVADPMFVDAANDDYRVKPDSPAFQLAFKAIPVEKIGPQGLPPLMPKK
jgi:hypothetical protein